jgi:hypothetical protein
MMRFLLLLICTITNGSRAMPVQSGAWLRATLNGKEWVAAEMIPDKYLSEIVQIWGTQKNSALTLQLDQPVSGKTHDLEVTDMNHYTDENSNYYMIKSGKITVTAMNDKWIEGKFSFIAVDERSGKKITAENGSFKIPNPKIFNK